MDRVTFGIEEEFLVVDSVGQLSFRGAELGRDDGDGDLQQELSRCQVETATGICTDAVEALGQLTRLREGLAGRARALGVRVLPSGAPILAQEAEPGITPVPRYRRIAEEFGPIVTTGNTCGCHVHVAIPDKETGVRISNHVRPWLPVLLALTANSPFFHGQGTRYSSWRHVLWSRWPSAGPPPLFVSLDHYESSVQGLLCSEAMLDRGMNYWDIRLSEQHPTIEFRCCDVAVTARQAVMMAVLVRGLGGARDARHRRWTRPCAAGP